MQQSFHPISIFNEDPFSKIIAYPNPTKRQITSRIKELKKLGITKVSFQGPTKIENLNILGKGYVGVVILAKKNSKTVALKIRRLDSQREGMKNEAKMLGFANNVGVGPKLISVSKNFLIMEYLSGEKISDWFMNIKIKGNTKKIKSVVKKILKDCYKLDKSGFDHGELSSISKHVIIGKKTTIIDFESSSVKRRVSNVTSATQGIFIGSGISKKIHQAYKLPRKDKIINALREYKNNSNQNSFDNVLKTLKL